MAPNKTDATNILPTDEDLVKRSKDWASIIEKYDGVDEKADFSLLDVCATYDLESTDTDSIESVDKGSFVVANEGEGSEIGTDEIKLCKEAAKKQRDRFRERGLDCVLNTFCVKEIEKVELWLQRHEEVFSHNIKNSDGKCESVFQHTKSVNICQRINNYSDEDSLGSVDTAKYILANRKVTLASVKKYRFNTNTIFKECSSKSKSRPLVNLQIPSSKDFIKNSQIWDKRKEVSNRNFSKRRLVSSNKFKTRNKDDMSSDSEVPQEQSPRNKYMLTKRPKRRKRQRSNTESSSSSCFSVAKKSSDLAITRSEEPVKHVDCVAPTCAKQSGTISTNQSKEKVVLYTPKNPTNKYPKGLIRNGKVVITDKYLEKMIGKQLKDKYLDGKKAFNAEFNSKSTIYFYLPDEVSSSDSDVDILERRSINRRGRILEIEPFSPERSGASLG